MHHAASSSLQVNAKYCQFPPSGLNQVSVYAEDYVCLEDESFLNDVIIDFYLRYLQFNLMSEVQCIRSSQLLMSSSHCFGCKRFI